MNYQQLSAQQAEDLELRQLVNNPTSTSLIINQIETPNLNSSVYCNINQTKARPFIPTNMRTAIFKKFQNLTHPGNRATKKLISDRFVWRSMQQDLGQWARACVGCQKAKINRHTRERFQIVHLNLVGPLPPSKDFVYYLTMIDRFLYWPEAIPFPDMTAETVAKAFFGQWIALYGAPIRIVTYQGRQFESQLYQSLSSLMGIKKCEHLRITFKPTGNWKDGTAHLKRQ